MPWTHFWKTPLPNCSYSPYDICGTVSKIYGYRILVVAKLLKKNYDYDCGLYEIQDIQQFLYEKIHKKLDDLYQNPQNFFQMVNIPERFLFSLVKKRLLFKIRELWTKYYEMKDTKTPPIYVRIIYIDDPENPNKQNFEVVDPASEEDLIFYLKLEECLSKLPHDEYFVVINNLLYDKSIREICNMMPHYSEYRKRRKRNEGLRKLKNCMENRS